MRWMRCVVPALEEQAVAIDGKTVRRSHRRDQRAIHLVSAYGAGLGMVLGQVCTAEKSNEITAIPELLDALLLKGAIVTIDAMGCQRDIALKIVQAQADYVLAMKENQAYALARIRRVHEAVERMPEAQRREVVSEYRDIDKGHGRIETRHCTVIDWDKLDTIAPWPGARCAPHRLRRSFALGHRKRDALDPGHGLWRGSVPGAGEERGTELRYSPAHRHESAAPGPHRQNGPENPPPQGLRQRPLPRATARMA